jgi:hypothetical protein
MLVGRFSPTVGDCAISPAVGAVRVDISGHQISVPDTARADVMHKPA